MEVYYVIGLDDDWKPQHTMRIASREPITQDNISEAFKNAYAKVVIAQEVSDMGVVVESATNDRQAALDALFEITSWANKGVDACTRGKTVPDIYSLKQTIRAALTAQDVNAEIDLDNAREVFENWLTGNGNYPHLKHKSFGGQYLNEEAAIKWDGFKAGYYARAEQKGGE